MYCKFWINYQSWALATFYSLRHCDVCHLFISRQWCGGAKSGASAQHCMLCMQIRAHFIQTMTLDHAGGQWQTPFFVTSTFVTNEVNFLTITNFRYVLKKSNEFRFFVSFTQNSLFVSSARDYCRYTEKDYICLLLYHLFKVRITTNF